MSEIHDADSTGDQEREDLLADLAMALDAEPERDDGAFGDLERLAAGGQQELSISADGLWARLPRVDKEATYEAIIALLERHNIRHGIDFESIREALAKSARGQVQFGVIVAQGQMPREVARARVEYSLPLADDSDNFAALCAVLEAPDVDALARFSATVNTVVPGQRLAEWIPPKIEPGRSVRGEALQPVVQAQSGLRPGANVSLGLDGRSLQADIYGYAGMRNGRLEIVAPLWTSPDGTEVRFVHWPCTSKAVPKVDDLSRLLGLQFIEYGLLESQIEQACAAVAADAKQAFTRVIAEGQAAKTGTNAQIDYTFAPESLLTWQQMHLFLRSPNVGELRRALHELLENPSLVFPLVLGGTVLAQKQEAAAGELGRSVSGDALVAEEGEDVLLEAGEYAELSGDKLRCTAEICGYVCQRGAQVSLVPPLWVAPDASAAYFLNLPQGANPVYPQLQEMIELLDLFGVTHGFEPRQWQQTLLELEAGRQRALLVPVAQAKSAVPGRDAEFEWKVDLENKKIGHILEDGSIDFRARSTATHVQPNTLLGVLTPPSQGAPGRDILGREIPPPKPQNIEIATDSHVRGERRGQSIAFLAESGGEVTSERDFKRTRHRTRRRLRIGISLVSNVDGDVGYGTGNIDFHGDVVITGSVQSLFTVKAEGSIHVGGYIEAGAVVQAGKDVLVKGGIIGANTEVEAGGTIWSKLVQEARLSAGGDVQVGAYIFNASVRARGRVVVMGRGEGRSRSLVGGLIWGGKGIEALTVGSPYNSATRLVAGVDPERVDRLEKLRADMRHSEKVVRQLMRRLEIDSLEVAAIRAKLRRMPAGEEKKRLVQGAKRLLRISQVRTALRQEMQVIIEAQREQALAADIAIRDQLFSGVEVRLGEETMAIVEERQRVHFQLVLEEGQRKLKMRPLLA